MQNAAFEKAGLGRPYGRFHVTKEGLGDFAAFAKKNLSGVNITVPHKENIIPFVDEIDAVAALSSSVNTLPLSNHQYPDSGLLLLKMKHIVVRRHIESLEV